MNNVTEITLSGKKHTLVFGMASYFELLRLSKENPTVNFVKGATDIIYSGILNNCIIKTKPAPKYEEIFAAIDAAFMDEDVLKDVLEVTEFYKSTTVGQKMFGAGEEIKKKAEHEGVELPAPIQEALNQLK